MEKRVLSRTMLALLVVGTSTLITSSFFVMNGLAWSNGGYSADPSNPDYGTHDWIAQHALDWLPYEEKQFILDNLAAYLYGTELPDNNQASDGIGDTAKHHIYYDSVEMMTDDAAAVRASTEYVNTLNFLKAEDYSKAAKNAGIMSHYIVDMAVFGHVMGSGTDWGAEMHHSDYETYVNGRTSSYSAQFNSYLSFDGVLTAISAYDAAKNLAYDTTFDFDGDLTCVWMDQNYDWNNPTFKNRMGESLNLAVNYLADVLYTLYHASAGEAYITLPYHNQIKSYYCGPASLEMLFDFYGPDIPQLQIADVARTAPDGTYTGDMIRAAQFSNLSTSVGKEMLGNITGYTARKLGYAAFEYSGMTINELKSLIAAGYPTIVLTTWHYRVAVGYNSTHITFQDSYYGEMFNMTYEAFDVDWDYSSHWGLFVSPWKIEVSIPSNVMKGDIFNITATITYPSYPPFPTKQYPASFANATVTLPLGLTPVSGETTKKIIGTGDLAPGATAGVIWTVRADSVGTYTISVEAEGKVTGFVPPVPSYPESYSYDDRIGGFGQSVVTVISDEIPPTTFDDYDGLWHTTDFTITLTATDDMSGVAETCYKINDGPTKNVSVDGHLLITAEGNNKLEYWSVDNVGNEEIHHILTGIKLDKTVPIGSVLINDNVSYATSTSVTLTLSATDATSGVYQFRFSNDGVWDTEPWETPSPTKTWILTFGDGTKAVYYQIKDKAGLISDTYSDTVILDTTAPTISITSPSPGYQIRSSTISVTWIGSDEASRISYYEIRIDGGAWTNIGTNTTYNFTGIGDGNHTIDIKATDKAGNTKQDTVDFVVNTSPLLGPSYVEEAAITAIVIIAALGTAVYFIKMRKKS